jgi:DNA processing protein
MGSHATLPAVVTVIPSARVQYALTLGRLPGVGRRTVALAMDRLETEDALLGATNRQLEDRLGRRAATAIADGRSSWQVAADRARRTVDEHVAAGVMMVALGDPAYPALLAVAPDPPVVLFVRGSIEALAGATPVAVVGTRDATRIGLELARRIARRFTSAGAVIVSGLAAGVDSAAHEGALEGGTTIAVLGTAIDKIYPAANKGLAAAIEHRGALVSEYAIGAPTNGNSFVERDRIQAGLSLAVIPVQTGLKGGTQHTIRFAEEANRRLLTPEPHPSESDAPQWQGIRALLDEGRARAFDADDIPAIVDELATVRATLVEQARSPARPMTKATKRTRKTPPVDQEMLLLPEDDADASSGEVSPTSPIYSMDEVVLALDATLDRLGPKYDQAAFDEIVRSWRRRRYP